jgi:undecaprenyl-diphosphatase
MKLKLLTLLLILAAIIECNNASAKTNNEIAIQQTAENKNWIRTGINDFDLTIIHFLQKFSQKNRFADEFCVVVTQYNLFKGSVIMVALWWLWFLPDTQEKLKRRVMLILTLLSGFIAVLVGRILVISLPFRIRPMNNPELHLLVPFGANNDGLAKMSSFPSDHAVLFFALCTGLFLVSKRTGILAYIYTFFFIIFSRVYLCYHYPSDVLVGAFIGIALCYFFCTNAWTQKIGNKIYTFSEQKPQFFYPLFFLITYQIVDLFGELRAVAKFFLHYL